MFLLRTSPQESQDCEEMKETPVPRPGPGLNRDDWEGKGGRLAGCVILLVA